MLGSHLLVTVGHQSLDVISLVSGPLIESRTQGPGLMEGGALGLSHRGDLWNLIPIFAELRGEIIERELGPVLLFCCLFRLAGTLCTM